MKKTCKHCGLELPIEQFHKQLHGKYGVVTVCKSCNTIKFKLTYVPTGTAPGKPKGYPGKKFTQEQFESKSNLIHNNKYDYSKSEYVVNKQKVIIICPIHGEFSQSASDHMQGRGCRKCGNSKERVNKLNLDEFIRRANIVHYNKYDYSLSVYINDNTKLKVICPIHGVFETKPGGHVRSKNGCPKCQESIGERVVRQFLDEHNILYKQEHKFKDCKYKRCLHFDFYLPEKNIIIEYDGPQHFTPIRFNGIRKEDAIYNFKIGQIKDKIKTDYCFENNITLYRIKYTDDIQLKLTEILT